jgi:DNA-binding NarL/FixJ family response regulator
VVIGEAADGVEALRKAKELNPDVVLMDVDMPELNGLSATEILRRENPEIKVLLISMHSYTRHMPRILQSGARGFVLKDIKPPELVAAIAKVAAGETCFSSEAARHALNHYANTCGGEAGVSILTGREREVLAGIADGLSNKQLATRLGISARTIETHRNHIMRKLNIHTVAGLTRFAIAEGLVVLAETSNRNSSTE